MVGAICGRVTFQKTCDSLAPSIRAASVNSVGTALIADEKITIANPTCSQMRTTISHMLLYGFSRMKSMVLGTTSPAVGRLESTDSGDEQQVGEHGQEQREADRESGPRPIAFTDGLPRQ